MKILFILILLFSSLAFANNDLTNKKLLCSKILWGFDFISSNVVKVIDTDINNNTQIKEYNYDTDLELSYVNIL